MTSILNSTRLFAAGALLFVSAIFLLNVPARAATFLTSDITNWIGPAAGPGVNEAVIVIDWADGQPAWAWGFRWNASEPKTGRDLLSALLGAEPRLTVEGDAFVSHFAWDGDLDPSTPPDRFRGGFNPDTGEYWSYLVNNEQKPDDYTSGAHLFPPLGSPYDEDGPGRWVSSNTGLFDRPLADGSWDGFIYAEFGTSGPGLPVNAPALIPEPSSALLLALAGLLPRARRRRQP